MKLKDIIAWKNGNPCAGGTDEKKCRVIHYVCICLMLALLGAGMGIVSLGLASSYQGKSGIPMFMSYFRVPLIILLNLLPCVILVFLFYFILGRAWTAFAVSGGVILLASLVNYYKIRIRSETFLASDIGFAGEAAGILSRYKIEFTTYTAAAIVCFIAGIAVSVFLLRGKLKNARVRICGAAAMVLLSAVLYLTVYTSPAVYAKADNSADINIWSDFQIFVSKGFVYPFIHSIPDAIPKKPEGYSDGEALKVLSAYVDDDIPEDKKVNVIAVMLEAYSDLSELPEVPVYDSVYAPLHRLQQESICGHVISNVFAGGTVNTERSFLTGYTDCGDFRAATNSFVYWLRRQGYTAEGFHAGDDWFYNRDNIQKYLGMENYYFLQDYNTDNRTDAFFFDVIDDLYEDRDRDRPYFGFSITYQNHGAYYSDWTVENSFLDPSGLTVASYNILNNYLSGIADTTSRMEKFVDGFRDDDEPVVIVFFGDHMPWLGDSNSVYNELGININASTEDGFYNYYSVPYIIWANSAAKDAVGNDFTGDGGDVSAAFLMTKLADACSWQGSALMKMQRDFLYDINIVNSGSGIYCVNGELTKTPSGETEKRILRYRNAQYYLEHNFEYGDLYG